MGKKLKRANKIGANFALIIGEEEFNNNSLSIKNLSSGNQETLSLDLLNQYHF
jgi:histidyl-tRNA synthetase